MTLEPLRIGLLHWTSAPTTGGVESHLADLAAALGAAGNQVTVLTGEPRPAAAAYETISLATLNLDRVRDGGDRLGDVLQDLEREIRARRLSVVHGHNLHHFSPLPALALNRLREALRIRLFHTFHETWPNVLQDLPVYEAWDGNFAVSEFVRRQCGSRFGFLPTLMPLGVDVGRFRPTRTVMTDVAPITILHPARLLPWKGVHVSVRSVGALCRMGLPVRLRVTDTQRIADWNRELVSYRKEIVDLIQAEALEGVVEFRSAEYEEMPALYNDVDIVVYPTVEDEPFGLVPLEAMACGRPVIVSRSGGMTETVIDGVTGYICERNDVAGLVDTVRRLAMAPDLARRLGNAGREHVCRRFSLTTYVDMLLARYRGLG